MVAHIAIFKQYCDSVVAYPVVATTMRSRLQQKQTQKCHFSLFTCLLGSGVIVTKIYTEKNITKKYIIN